MNKFYTEKKKKMYEMAKTPFACMMIGVHNIDKDNEKEEAFRMLEKDLKKDFKNVRFIRIKHPDTSYVIYQIHVLLKDDPCTCSMPFCEKPFEFKVAYTFSEILENLL